MNAKQTMTNIMPAVLLLGSIFSARQAEVEKNKNLTEANLPPIAMTAADQTMRGARHR
jgi:hypothetical protein